MVLCEKDVTGHEGRGGNEQEWGDDHKERRMHSFDRRLKSAHKELDPDLDANLPNYMRQTCASLVKRNSFKMRDLETLDPRCARPKTSKDRTLKRSKSSVGREGRRSGSRSSSRRSTGSSTPRSDLSMVAESVDGSPSPSEANPPRSSSESIIRNVESVEPKADTEDMSSMMEACFDDVIHDALVKGETSLDIEGLNTDLLHVTSFTSIEAVDDKSEVVRDDSDSFCFVYDPDDGKPTEIAIPISDLVEVTEENVPSLTPMAPLEEEEDVFKVMEEAKWLEDEEEEEQLKCHQLTDIRASFTDSEFGDISSQPALDRVSYFAEEDSLRAFGSASNLQIPYHMIPLNEDVQLPPHMISLDDEIQLLTGTERKLKSTTCFQSSTPGFLMMLGGNVLAGVVGAAIASAGMQVSTQTNAWEVKEERHSEGDPSRDWFFESTTVGQRDS